MYNFALDFVKRIGKVNITRDEFRKLEAELRQQRERLTGNHNVAELNLLKGAMKYADTLRRYVD